MRNFDYLQQIPALQDLYKYCHAAEEMQQTDYDSCGWNCRKALEWTVRAVYKLKHETIGERDNLYTLSTGKAFTDLIDDDDKLMMAVHYVRKVGNNGAHGVKVTRKESFFCLLNIYNVVAAILHKLTILKTVAPFNKELIPKKPQPPALTPATVTVTPHSTIVEAASKEAVEDKTPVVEMECDISEAETRKLFIDLMLKEAGWEVLDTEGSVQPSKACIEVEVQGMPTDTGTGYCDYVLFGSNGLPLAVVEAKRTSVSPTKGKHQAELYAECLEKRYGVKPVIYYTNGFETNIIDGLGYPPRRL
jgi:type I restriction enzyme R subunit